MSLTKWEYLHITIHNAKKSFRGEWRTREDILGVLGGEGWEMVAVLADHREEWEAFYFKRPLP